MTAMNVPVRSGLALARELRRAMQGKVALLGDDAYERACRIRNGAVDHRPLAVAQCETVKDVQAALRIAADYGMPLSVRGGGHDWAGRSLCTDGLVVDLSTMRKIEINAKAHAAVIAGGAMAGGLVAAASPYGLGAVTGPVASVGMTGLTLGGGYGPLSARHGLALDNMLGATVVLADGRHVVTDASENPDLFWALRGGGGNFGVVTSLHIRLHPMRMLLAGIILFQWSDAEAVLRRYADIAASAPDELTVTAGLLSTADGRPALFLAPTWSGELARGEHELAKLLQLGMPLLAQMGPMSCLDMLRMYDAHVVHGRHYAVETRWLPALTPEVIASLVAAGAARSSPHSAIVIHHCHGAPTRVPVEATAFGLRREHFQVEIIAGWAPEDNDGPVHRHWMQTLSRSLEPASLPGGYPNLLGPDDDDRAALSYGPNLPRLLAVKRQYDPRSVFSATPLPI
jgi:hypothetical protein